MPKKNNAIHTKVVDGLVSISPSVWKKKDLVTDKDGKEQVVTTSITRSALRYPLAQNVSDDNVERLARRWL